LIYRRL